MRLLDRYVRNIFVGALAVCLVIFTAMWVVGDFFGKLDDILEAMQEEPDRSTGTMIKLLGQYFLANLPFFLHQTAPFVPLIAALYTMSRLLRANELTPMVVAGRSLFRVLRPVFVWSLLFAGLIMLQQELVLPHLALDQQHLGRRIRGKSTRELKDLPIIADRSGNRYVIERYDPVERAPAITRLIMTRTERQPNGELILRRRVISPHAVWKEEDGGKGWHLAPGSIEERRYEDGTVRRFKVSFLHESALRPKDIEQAKLDKPARSIPELRRSLRRQPDPIVAVEIHRHVTHPLKCLMLLLLGLPFLMRAYLRHVSVGPVLKCMLACVLFYVFDFLCLDLGNREYLSPVVAAWLPIVVFVAIGTLLLDRVRS